MITRNNLKQLVSKPTYIRSGSLIDLCVTDLSLNLHVTVGNDYGSDHLPVIAKINYHSKRIKKVALSKTVRCMYHKSPAFMDDLNSLCNTYALVHNTDDPHSLWNDFNTRFNFLYDKHFPSRVIMITNRRTTRPLSPELIHRLRRQRELYYFAKKIRSELAWNNYLTYKKSLTTDIKKYQFNVTRRRLDGAKDIKSKWRVLNTIIKSRKTGGQVLNISSDKFADQFKTNVQHIMNVVNASSNCNNDVDCLQYLDPVCNCNFDWDVVESTEIMQ
jgi:hypothetical protein